MTPLWARVQASNRSHSSHHPLGVGANRSCWRLSPFLVFHSLFIIATDESSHTTSTYQTFARFCNCALQGCLSKADQAPFNLRQSDRKVGAIRRRLNGWQQLQSQLAVVGCILTRPVRFQSRIVVCIDLLGQQAWATSILHLI